MIPKLGKGPCLIYVSYEPTKEPYSSRLEEVVVSKSSLPFWHRHEICRTGTEKFSVGSSTMLADACSKPWYWCSVQLRNRVWCTPYNMDLPAFRTIASIVRSFQLLIDAPKCHTQRWTPRQSRITLLAIVGGLDPSPRSNFLSQSSTGAQAFD